MKKFRKIDHDNLRFQEAREQGEKWRIKEGLRNCDSKVGELLVTELYSIYRDAIVFPSGNVGTYLRLQVAEETGKCSAALTMLDDKIVLMVQERYPADAVILETPRGFGRLSETGDASIRREVEEETGGKTVDVVSLGGIYTNSGISDEFVYLYFVRINKIGTSLEDGVRRIVLFDKSEIECNISQGKIFDPFFLASYAIAKQRKII